MTERFTDTASTGFDEGRLVWIFGSSRSGSTWLLEMLGELPGSVAIDDPHLGHHLGVWRPIPLAWAASSDRPQLTTLDAVKREQESYFFSERYAEVWRPALRELIVARFTAQAGETEGATAGSPIFVKEPGSQAAGLLRDLFPRSRFVFLLRDGRDVVDSWLDGYGDGSWAQPEGAFPLAEHGREAFIRWQASVWRYRTEEVARAYDRHDPARRVLVRYEELLARPARELARICEAASIEAGRETLERIAGAHHFAALPAAHRGAGSRARAASPGGWRENLTPPEREAMLSELGGTLAAFGYASREEAPRAA